MPEIDDERDVLDMTTSDVLASHSDGIGASLRQERVRRQQSVAEVSQETGLPQWMVKGLEAEELSLEDAQNKAYLRIYAREVGLDAESLLRNLDDGRGEPPEPMASLSGPVEDEHPAPPPPPRLPTPRPAVLLGLGLSAAVAALLGVLVWGGERAAEVPAPPAATSEEVPTAPPEEPEQTDTVVDDEPDPGPDPDAMAARAPADTRVQVLHNGDAAAAEEVAATLEGLGYGEVRMDSTLAEIDRTTILYVEGWEAEAEALHSRDDRFAAVEPNAEYTADVDLHIEVGPDWAGAE
ncbi:MAG TPA: helix-turn-helix domain-containing protein [Egibacteraceae bacterium]|nr:helix-turn-helix domain-containing protein [Egibacteraceae bacterium]